MHIAHLKSLAIYVISCLGVSSLMSLYLYMSYHEEIKNAQARIENTSLLVAEWVEGYFAKSDYLLRDIVGMVNASDIGDLDVTSPRHKELSARMEAKRKTLPYTMRVAIFTDECVITHFPGYEHLIGTDVTRLEYCQVLRGRPDINSYVTHVYLGRVGKTLHVLQARRLVDERGQMNGFAGIAIDLELTDDLFDKITVPDHGIISIIDTNQTLVARKPAMKESIGKDIKSRSVAEFVQSSARFAMRFSQSPIDGEERIIAMRRTGDLPFVVAIGEGQREILRTWYQRVWGVTIVTLMFWGMAFIILRHYHKLLTQHQIIEHQATHDTLTGIPARRLIVERLQMACEQAKREQTKVAVLFIDLDGFKAANDHFGHKAGDHVLREIAGRIKQFIRSVDTVGRKGGDEFVVILNINSADEACIFAEKLVYLINDPVVFDNHPIPIGASIGIAIFPDHSEDPEKILALADQAMYKVKKTGKNNFKLYSTSKS
jgi:diguanylate cyclase (GGDEF)-like protein